MQNANANASTHCSGSSAPNLIRPSGPHHSVTTPRSIRFGARSSPATTGAGVHRLSMLPLAWIKERVMAFKDMGAGAPPTQQRILRYTCHTARNHSVSTPGNVSSPKFVHHSPWRLTTGRAAQSGSSPPAPRHRAPPIPQHSFSVKTTDSGVAKPVAMFWFPLPTQKSYLPAGWSQFQPS